jgi:3-hydroxyisobutyrate dehydrogenase
MTQPHKPRVGFVGMGLMGQPMSLNLMKKGFSLTAWNRTRGKTAAVAQAGAAIAGSPREVGERSDVVITCVSDSPDVEEVILGAQGVIHGLKRGGAVIDMSTISPDATRSIARRLAERSIDMLDAPVSGGTIGAQQGTLSIMVGGDAAVLERCRPVLEAVGTRITHCGPASMGQIAKLVNQIIVAGTLAAMCEGLVFAAKAGADLQAVLRAVSGGAANSWQLENLGPRILKGDFAPGFLVRLLQKDLRLVDQAAAELGVPQLTTPLVRQIVRATENLGYGEEGTQAYIKALEAIAGVEARAKR